MLRIFIHKRAARLCLPGGYLPIFTALLLTIATQQGCSTHGSNPADQSLFLLDTAEDPSSNLSNEQTTLSEVFQADNTMEVQRALNEFLSIWEGTPYRLGGNSRKSIDCSALTSRTYKELFDIDLPRTASAQASQGSTIPPSDLQPGDLVFFRIGRYQSHVGVYMGNNSFMHASTLKGVTLSKLDDPYWQKRFWKATSHHLLESANRTTASSNPSEVSR